MKKTQTNSRLRRMYARVVYFFVLTLPEVLFAHHAAPSVAGGETRLFWWGGAVLIVVVLGSIGMVSTLQTHTTPTNSSELSAEDFTIIEEEV